MTTTAFDDQFTDAPEPVHQPYDVAVILRKNVADLEKELQRQRERAEKAEAELKAAREQEPVAHVKYKQTGGNVGLSWIAVPTGAFYPRELEPLYVHPVPAPAVLEEWREVMAKLVGVVEASTGIHGCNDLTKQARALLQSASIGEPK